MANFIVEFPLLTEIFHENILNKRFEIARKIYNIILAKSFNRYKEMIKTRKYKDLINSLFNDNNKEIFKLINQLRKDYNLTEFSLHNDVKFIQKFYNKNIDSHTAQKIASNLWRAYEKLFFDNGKTIRFKRFGSLNSLEGKTNNSGIRFKDNKLYWFGLSIPVKINYDNEYEYLSMQNKICYCRIVRKFIKNKFHFYLQIVFEGKPPLRRRTIGNGDVGLDIGTQTLAVSSENKVQIYELASNINNIEKEKKRLLKKLDRQRRDNNKENYNEDGTIKLGKKKWNQSNKYIKNQNKLKDIFRKQREIRKQEHQKLSNIILSLGNKIYVETMNFKALQSRAKNIEISDKRGKFKRKKRFGKSLANKAPSLFLTILNNKLGYYGEKLIEINTIKARASQYNHIEENYKKKKLSQRWNDINGIKIQRDLYSAFLIMNIQENLEEFDLDKCKNRFNNFLSLHNKEIKRLSQNKNLSSIGI